MTIKIAMIGAGSIEFTQRLLHDILAVPELADTLFAFTDISERNLDMVTQLCRRDIAANGLPARIESTLERRRALADADYVFCTIRQGGLEAFATDIEIPLAYGVDQCVGDTICAGGLMYAQRSISELLEFCHDVREESKPSVLLLNYSNPMAMNTWACDRYGQVRTIGLCHGVQGAHKQIARCINRWAVERKLLSDEETVTAEHVDVIAAGINHQTWFIQVSWRGIDMIPHMLEMFMADPEFRQTEKVRIDVLQRFGFYSTESNGHLSEYLPWYRKRPAEIGEWIDYSQWYHGQTGGYLRACQRSRRRYETEFSKWMGAKSPKICSDRRSEEHGSYIIEALETGRTYRGHFNVINQGHITNLPDGCVVEIPGYVDRTGIHMPVVGTLPMACAATCAASARVQEMGMEAAVHGDVMLLKQAILHDPLVAAVCDPEEVWQMTDEMLVAQAQWLPQYREEIPRAQARLVEADRTGRRRRRGAPPDFSSAERARRTEAEPRV